MTETPLQELERLRQKQGPLEPSFWDDLKGFGRAAGQGVFLGFGDEITAALRSLGSDRSYEDLRQEELQELSEFKERYPGVALTAEIVGGLLVPYGGLARGAMTAARAAKIGGVTGGIYGAGATEGDLSDRAVGAASGAALSAGLGAGLQKVGSAGSSYLRRRFGNRPGSQYRGSRERAAAVGRMQGRFRKELELSDPETLKNLDRQNIPPSEAFRTSVTGRSTIADIPGMEGTVSGVTQGSSAARRIAERNLENRTKTEAETLMENGLERVLRATTDADDMALRVGKIVEDAETPYYERAKSVMLPSELFEDVFFDPVTKGVYNAHRANIRTFVNNNRTGFSEEDLLPAWDELIETSKDGVKRFKVSEIPTRYVHQLRQALDKKAKWAKSQVSAKEDVYRTLSRRINTEVEPLNSDYVIANRIHNIGEVTKDAVAKGAKALSKSSSTAVRQEYESLKGSIAKKAYRSGMLQEISNRAGTGSLGVFLSNPRNQKLRNALKAIFPDEQSFDKFVVKAERERGFRNTEALAGVGGSRTARTTEDIKAWQGGGFGQEAAELGTQAVAVSPEWAAARMVGKAMNRLRNINDEKIATEAANILFTRTPQEAKKAFDELLKTGKHLQGTDLAALRMIQRSLTASATPMGGLIGSEIPPFFE